MRLNKLFLILTILSALFFIHQGHTSESISPKRVLIASPIRQKPHVLCEFLHSLARLKKETFTADYCFIDDNIIAESTQVLMQFYNEHPHHCTLITPTECFIGDNDLFDHTANQYTHAWKSATVWKVAAFKDYIINKARVEKYDYLFLLDSDLILHPHTLETLIAAGKPIVSEIYWTRWSPTTVLEPQVWLYDNYDSSPLNYPGEDISNEEKAARYWQWTGMLKEPGLYEVGGLGGCTLMDKSALEAGVKFKRIENLSFWGEDRHFCVRARAYDIPLFVDTHYPAYHIYRDTDFEGVTQYVEDCNQIP